MTVPGVVGGNGATSGMADDRRRTCSSSPPTWVGTAAAETPTAVGVLLHSMYATFVTTSRSRASHATR